MNEEAIARVIEERFPVKTFKEEGGFQLHIDGVQEHLHLSFSGDEFALFSEEGWHEHIEDEDSLFKFVEDLLSGQIQVVIKYRGKTPVGHQVQRMEGDQKRVMSRTGSLVSPFWRPKSFKRLNYRAANPSLQPTRNPRG